MRGASTDVALIALARRDAVDGDTFRNNWNLTANAMLELVQRSGLVERGDHIVCPELARSTERAVVDTLAKHHETDRESAGMSLESLVNTLATSTTIARIAIENLTESGEVRTQSGSYALAEHSAEIPQALAALFDRIEPLLDSEQPPSLGDIAKQFRTPLPALERDMRALAAIGLCQRVSTEPLLPECASARHGRRIALNLQESFTVRQFRDASGMGRNVVIEVLEHFDRKGFTRREGDARRVVGDPGQVLD